MQSVQEIYREKISGLSSKERLKLAALILNDLAAAKTEEKLSAVTLLESFPSDRAFRTSAEVDKYLREERNSWDR